MQKLFPFINTFILLLILAVVSHFVFNVFPASVTVQEHLAFMTECSKWRDKIADEVESQKSMAEEQSTEFEQALRIIEGESLTDYYISCAHSVKKAWFPD